MTRIRCIIMRELACILICGTGGGSAWLTGSVYIFSAVRNTRSDTYRVLYSRVVIQHNPTLSN